MLKYLQYEPLPNDALQALELQFRADKRDNLVTKQVKLDTK